MNNDLSMPSLSQLRFDNTFARQFPQLHTRLEPTPLREPFLVHTNAAVAKLLDIDLDVHSPEELAHYFGGHTPLPGSEPLAMTYSGHQFGQYNPQLGDGRGLLLGEVLNERGERWDLHLKGAGRTPYSRFGDGRAVLRSSIREYLCSEAMHGLGIPSTRALCVVGSKESVQRETREAGATLLRVADSHIRFGHFEWLFNNRPELLRPLADYVIDRHYPECRGAAKPVAALLHAVVTRTARLMADWQKSGFAHGVMNTDNFSITGSTFDYGPFGFLDAYEPGYVCNHSDHTGRYAWNQQPSIGLWNLNALAYALSPLVEQDDIVAALHYYEPTLLEHYYSGMRGKLGLASTRDDDTALIMGLLDLMMKNGGDYTRTFRGLSHVRLEDERCPLRDDFVDREGFDAWFEIYRQRLLLEGRTDTERQSAMLRQNPKYILRNYLAQIAINKADNGDYSEVKRLLQLLQSPYEEWPEHEAYAGLPPDWGRKMVISCSS